MRKVGSVSGNRAVVGRPGSPSVAEALPVSDAAVRSTARRVSPTRSSLKSVARNARCQAEASAHVAVSCGPSVPLVTPLPSGRGVTGTKVSRKG
jgi:hypothetical protein